MLDRELTYRVPFKRLAKLGRSAGRKAFASGWYATWLILAGYFVVLGALAFFDDEITRFNREAGTPWWLWLALLIVATFAGLYLVRRQMRGAVQSRADFDSTIRLRQEPEGLRFATPEIEYLVKWNGISQMLMEHDGVVISHGALFFLIPDDAFSSKDERDAFIREVFGRLSEAAQERSAHLVRSVLDPGQNPTRT